VEQLKRRIRLFLMGLCPVCEKWHYDSYIDANSTIQYTCPDCGILNYNIEEIIDGLVS